MQRPNIDLCWRHKRRLFSIVSILAQSQGYSMYAKDIRKLVEINKSEFKVALKDLEFYNLVESSIPRDMFEVDPLTNKEKKVRDKFLVLTPNGIDYYRYMESGFDLE